MERLVNNSEVELSVIMLDGKTPDYIDDMAAEMEVLHVGKSGTFLSEINQSILTARGKYLFFCFAEDSFEDEGEIQEAIDFLEANSSVDIVFFPQICEDEIYTDECKDKNPTGLYYAELEPEYEIGTFNFVVRRQEGHIFDEGLSARCAYLQYVLNALPENGFFGVVNTGCQRHRQCVFDKFSLTEYGSYRRTYEYLLSLLDEQENGRIGFGAYAQGVAAKVLDDILIEKALIPEDFSTYQKESLRELLGGILERVNMDILMRCKQIDKYHLCYLLSIRNRKVNVLSDKRSFGIYDEEEEILTWQRLGFWVGSAKIVDGSLHIKGYFQNPASCLIRFEPYLLKNGKKIEIETTESLISYRGTSQKIAVCQEFELKVPCHENAKYRFRANILGQDYPVKLFLDEYLNVCTPFGYRAEQGGTEYLIEKSCITVQKMGWRSRLNSRKAEKDKYRSLYPDEFAVRTELQKKKRKNKKRIALYVNVLGVSAFTQFYIQESKKTDGVVRYYCSCNMEQAVPGQITFRGEQHKLLSVLASEIYVSSPETRLYSAFDEEECRFYQNLVDAKLYFVHEPMDLRRQKETLLSGVMNMDEEILL